MFEKVATPLAARCKLRWLPAAHVLLRLCCPLGSVLSLQRIAAGLGEQWLHRSLRAESCAGYRLPMCC